MRIRDISARIKAHGFLHSVGVLVGGTAFAQVIMALALPVLTRLYTPHDFGVLAVFTGLVSIVSVAACLRFDVAVSIPDQDSDAANVLGLAMLCTLAVSGVLAIAVSSVPEWTLAHFNQLRLQPYLWLVPIGVLFGSSYSAFQFWFVRRKDFGIIARNRLAQGCAGSGIQIGCGWLGWNPLGLILGPIVNNGVGCIHLGYRIAKTERASLATMNWSRMRSLFHVYHRFPKYSTFEAVSNSAGLQLPIIMIAGLASAPEAGFLLLAMYAMQAPMGLIGNAIAQVYLSRAPDEFRAERLGDFTTRVVGGLMKSGVGPLIFAGLVAPALFAEIFGSDWRRAGVLMSWMTPWFIMQFLAVPVSMALHVTNRQKAAFILQLFGLILRVSAVYLTSMWAAAAISEAYALSGFVFYLAYLVLIFHAVGVRTADIMREFRSGIAIVSLWGLAGAVVALIFESLRTLS